MKKPVIFFLALFQFILVSAGVVEKTFYFSNYTIETRGSYQTVNFPNTHLSGIPGEPLLPWHEVTLMLPPGEAAESIEVVEENETAIPGTFLLFPKQRVQPTSLEKPGEFIRNERVYQQRAIYPASSSGHLLTQYLNGYAFALCTVTPVKYNPAGRTLSYFKKLTVRITTRLNSQSQAALTFLPPGGETPVLVKSFAMNPGMIDNYPQQKASPTNYEYLIISPVSFKNEFQPMISMYAAKGITTKVITTDSISSVGTGWDLQEKIRNFIISQVQQFGVKYVLLAGNKQFVPIRGFYCHVTSGSGYSDSAIPADIYYSGLNGSYDANGNHIYGELADGADLLPDIAVGRFTVNDTVELHRMIRKSVAYQTNPVLGEFSRPLLAGEWLYNSPLTYGGDYMNMLIDNRSDNGYFTHGIPSATNSITKLYDTPSPAYTWDAPTLRASINQGKSFIHHLGHANTTYMMRMDISAITNANFSQVNGITHNFTLLYTQGCYDGAFDVTTGCIAGKAVTIDNFLVAGIFNSRYGWFDEGTTEGPSEHLEREFVSALYNDTLPEKHLGAAHMISKIKTAPWVSLPGEFEPGAQLWCHYCCNVFGDPAMEVWTEEPATAIEVTWTGSIDSEWQKAGNWNPGIVPGSVCNVTIPATSNNPVISTTGISCCHNLLIQGGGNLTINPGKSMVVYGTVTMNGE